MLGRRLKSVAWQLPGPFVSSISRSALEPGDDSVIFTADPASCLPASLIELSDRTVACGPQLTNSVTFVAATTSPPPLHMLVEALFWFHPLVWWLGARLVDERERACDEEVLRLGSDPQIYAESILKICEFYLESPLLCAQVV